MSLIRPTVAKARRDKGQTLVMFVIFLIVLMLFVGLVIDFGFAYVTRASLSKAVDAASLTGARNLSLGKAQAEVLARAAFDANYRPTTLDASPPTVDITFTTDTSSNTL